MPLQNIRSSTANKRPTPGAMSDGQLALNTQSDSPGVFFKDGNGDLVKVGPVHVGPTAPNATPAAGGQTGNSKGELWLDTASSRYVFKIWDGTAWRTEDGEFVNSSGDTMTGALVMDNQQPVRFREATANGTNFIALQASAAVASDKTITLPDITGTVVTTGDTGSVTSAMIASGTIVDGDISASAAIVDTKLATISTTGKVSNSATTAASANTPSAIVSRDSSGNFVAGTITANLTGTASNVTTNANLTGDITSTGNATAIAVGVIVDADVNASAAIAFSKLANVSATDRLLGRSTAGAGAIEEIVCTAAGRALIDDATNTAQRTTLGLGTIATLAAPSGTVVGTTDTQTLTNKTLTDPAIVGTILEDVFTITDGAAFEVDPGNGSIQLITLGASRTPKATSFAAGESVTLMVADGTAFALTWTDTTWGSGGVVWVGGSAPTLATTGYTVIQFWKVSTTVYGAHVGNVA